MTAQVRVLVVDDDPLSRRATVRVFRAIAEVEEVCGVESAAAALAMLGAWRPDVVISDYRMPEQDGADFLFELAAYWPWVRRVLYTALPNTPAVPATVVVRKPATTEELKAACGLPGRKFS
jgi:CheY-like chemotaxis protein